MLTLLMAAAVLQVDPQAAIADLKADIQALVASGELSVLHGTSLQKSLTAASNRIASGNIEGAKSILRNFNTVVGRYVDAGVLSATAAQDLIDQSTAIIAALGG